MYSQAEIVTVDDGFDMLDYGYAAGGARWQDKRSHGERNLWCAVIAQAFIDMGVIAGPTSNRRPDAPRPQGRLPDEAARWLLRDSPNFTYICELAGVSPQIIRRAAQIFYAGSAPDEQVSGQE